MKIHNLQIHTYVIIIAIAICLRGGFYVFMGFFMGLLLPPTIYFAGACYYVTFIPCSPPSLTAAIMYPTKPTATHVFNLQ